MNQPSSATSRALFIFAKKVMTDVKRKKQLGVPDQVTSDFRESMVELHQRWYETEGGWQAFLKAVRSRNQAEISDKLMDAAVAMFSLATATYQGPLSYEASLSPENMRSLVEQGECPDCDIQGDIEAILPHPKSPQWKLRCPECNNTWLTKEPAVKV